MATISSEDIIYASVTSKGVTIANLCISGFNTLSALMKHIFSLIGGAAGLVTINFRNASRGWTSQHSVRLAS